MNDAALIERYQTVRARTEALCAPLQIEDYCLQAMENASPPKWHLAHVSWFFETFILVPYAKQYRMLREEYAHLFNSYYETAGTFFPRPQRGMLSRPTVDEVYRYRRHVDAAMLDLLAQSPAQHSADIRQRLQLGIEHEIQHQELLLMDTRYNFSINPLHPAYHKIELPPVAPIAKMGWQEFAAGIVEIGHDGDAFAYDNERPQHKTYVQDFRLGTRLVNNAEYLAFIEDGGYDRVELWLSDGWRTIKEQYWQAPLYWFKQDRDWMHFDLTGAHALRLDEPVSHLSYYEADAYARWAGKRLPTEAEWEHAASTQAIAGNFLDSGLYVPRPASLSPTLSHGEREQTNRYANPMILQFYGDLWEWTRSAYLPYPGFRPLPGTLGEYNGKFMCDQMVLRGGCCATAQDHVRASYRNFFRAADRWMFSGLRLAEDIA
ncbi:MAG: ergothioneine biosynthesis protein EgtB [Gallionella sp.]|jgi:ergothioneine biosynthesis protein EgtB|nr:ergothioneine biosynthesis protein EgtB [Gallionella sp.]MCK9353726.1 ergothioneine biosynthesis protein EgtB [Gallionella sp.]